MARRRQSETLPRLHGDHAFLAPGYRLDVQSIFSALTVLVAIECHMYNLNHCIGRVPLYA